MAGVQPPWTPHREKVLLDRYSQKDQNGEPVETNYDQIARRVAEALAEVEEEDRKKECAEEFFEAIRSFRVVPGGRILAGAGTGTDLTFYNCTVVPVESNDPEQGKDSRHGIMDTIKNIVDITSRGGGVGVNWSVLRPKNSYVRGVNGKSSGSVSWMEAASSVAHQVEQGGSRRAALMFMLWDWHPDLLEFINVKRDMTKLEHANLSIAVSDDFMQAVANDEQWIMRFPDFTHPKYNEIWEGNIKDWENRGLPVVEYGIDSEEEIVPGGEPVSARWLWNKIVEAAYASGEPGVVFLERYNKQSNLWYTEEIISVNPCGEQGLGPYGVCNLCSINLVSHLKKENERVEIDYNLLKESVHTAVRFSDNVIETNEYFMRQHEMVQRYGARRIGIGTMGLADMLILLKVRYGSELSFDLIDRVYRVIAIEAYKASIELAKEKGSFPWFEKEKYLESYFIKTLPEAVSKDIKQYGIRNAMLLTQAPTGTTSILAGVSSGIEPVFSFSYTREDKTGKHKINHWLVEHFKEEYGEKELPEYFVTAMELSPEEHIHVQAAIQRHVDSSISKTVNAPKDHTPEDVDKLFKLAYKLGCKGITYFRTGSRRGVLTAEVEEVNVPESSMNVPFGKLKPIKRPDSLEGKSVKLRTPLGTLLVTLNYLDDRPIELLGIIGRAGSDVHAFTEAIARLISIALRSGIDPQVIANQLKGIGGSGAVGYGPNQVNSVPDAIGKFLEHRIREEGFSYGGEKEKRDLFKICPECGRALLVESEGCTLCLGCGYSAC